MHTPRLCIDGRAAMEFDAQGFIAQEVIDQLVAAQGEPGAGSDWIEKKRTVLLSHPDQIFSGQLKRYDTRKRIGSSFLYWAWEKHFIEQAAVSAFHRFRPADRLEPLLECPTITTVLPPRKGMHHTKLPVRPDHQFVVCSNADQNTLAESLEIPVEQIRVATPTSRRYVRYMDPILPAVDGQVLFIVDGKKQVDLKRLGSIVNSQFPHLPLRTVNLSDTKQFSGKAWAKQLQFTTICFYLTEQPFDWPFLALEALYFDVPVIFMDNHRALSEMLPLSTLSLSRYLADLNTSSQLKEAVSDARNKVMALGGFEEHSIARQYTQLYSAL